MKIGLGVKTCPYISAVHKSACFDTLIPESKNVFHIQLKPYVEDEIFRGTTSVRPFLTK